MNHSSRGLWGFVPALALAACSLLPPLVRAQTSANSEQWIHVRVESREDKTDTVRVNVPVDMAVKVLPAIKHKNLCDGKVHIDSAHLDDIDLHTLLDAVKTAKDGEYLTVRNKEDDVRVAKSAGYLYLHVTGKRPPSKGAKAGEGQESANKTATAERSKVEVKVPMKVVDALLSAGKDELDVVAALRALSAYGDIELVSVKDEDSTVRVWIDSKNVSE